MLLYDANMKILAFLTLFFTFTSLFAQNTHATKDDIKMILREMDKRFEDMMIMFISCFGILATVYIAIIGFLFGR